ncbi:87_t:CDS:1, partial [Funneliformis geosporum]
DSCKCKKNKQLLRTKKPKRGQQIYQRAYTPNSSFLKANKFLFDVNTKFDYNSNFEGTFSYTFCSACNSKFQ